MTTTTIGSAFVRMLCDSSFRGSRLSSLEVTLPRVLLAELNTHRALSRSSASSRAIPIWRRLWEAIDHPYIPASFGKNKAGMQAGEPISEADQESARCDWLVGRDIAVLQAYNLVGGMPEILASSKGHNDAHRLCMYVTNVLLEKYSDVAGAMRTLKEPLHKQHASRVLEPYLFHTVIISGTHWRNFLALRASKDAQPEMQDLGIAVASILRAGEPNTLSEGEWHRPYIVPADWDITQNELELAQISCGRCARVSFLTHHGIRDVASDLRLAKNLLTNGHMAPLEHVARAGGGQGLCGNFAPQWTQYRKLIEHEGDFSRRISREALVEGMRGDEGLADFVSELPS